MKRLFPRTPQDGLTNLERARRKAMFKKYGLTHEAYDRCLAEQGGVCAICRKACQMHHRLSVDHDHDTGRVRGLLCHSCNTGLGKFGDSLLTLEAACAYLKRCS